MNRRDLLRLLGLSLSGLVLGGGVVASLEDRVAALEQQIKGTLKLGPQQQGPLPGWFRAARIDGNQMTLNMTDSKVGIAPRLSVTDTAGITRAELGNLASYTGPNGKNSPAQYGFRANDATGNAIFDSLGLIAVAKPVGGTPLVLGAGSTTSAPFVVATSGPNSESVSFSTTRTTTILTLGHVVGQMAGGAGISGAAQAFIDGSVVGALAYFDGTLGAAYTNATFFSVDSIAAGPHTVDIRVSADGVNALSWLFIDMLVIQLGA